MFHLPSAYLSNDQSGEELFLTQRMAQAFKEAIDDPDFVEDKDLRDTGDVGWAIVGTVTDTIAHVSGKTASAALKGSSSTSSNEGDAACVREGIEFSTEKPNWGEMRCDVASRCLECERFGNIQELRDILVERLPNEDNPAYAVTNVFQWKEKDFAYVHVIRYMHSYKSYSFNKQTYTKLYGSATVKRAPNPFSNSGASRLAYYGVESYKNPKTGEITEKPVVLKQFKSMGISTCCAM
eukprot:scaffold673703_cov59-Prasinocladus_malaysianus.AAC.1